MHCLKLSTFLLVASVSLSSLHGLQAAPSSYKDCLKLSNFLLVASVSALAQWISHDLIEWRSKLEGPNGLLLFLFLMLLCSIYSCSFRVGKRKCNLATCVTQRLADFLSRSSNSLGPFYTPTNVGSNTYGKRDGMGLYSREVLSYLQR
uniref:calcitonin gene-related peptide 1 n=1 Tax=Pristiophorus japonicus TaxID=55135 RepID=UPI00398E84D6